MRDLKYNDLACKPNHLLELGRILTQEVPVSLSAKYITLEIDAVSNCTGFCRRVLRRYDAKSTDQHFKGDCVCLVNPKRRIALSQNF